MVSLSTRWSVYAGVAVFLAGAGAIVPLGIIAETLLMVLGLPTAYATTLVPLPGAVLGSIAWWAVVERPAVYEYRHGGVAGVLTVVLTVGVWTLLVALVYGPGVILVGETLTVLGIALGVTMPVGAVVLLVVLYARRRVHSERAGGTEPAAE